MDDAYKKKEMPNSVSVCSRSSMGNIHFSCSADHVQDWLPYAVDPYSCYMCDHTYIHTYIFTYIFIYT